MFKFKTNKNGITGLKRVGDKLNTEFIAKGKTLGSIIINRDDGVVEKVLSHPALDVSDALPPFIKLNKGLLLKNVFSLKGKFLLWTIKLKNTGRNEIKIKDIEIPLPMNTYYDTKDTKELMERRVFKHSYISGHGSFIFWMPAGGTGSFLVMTPLPNTKLEYFTEDYKNNNKSEYNVFIHSTGKGKKEKHGTWRQQHTSLTLQPGEEVNYGFKFDWADDYESVRKTLYRNNGFDVRVVPGMVIPQDLFAQFSLHTKNKIDRIVPEFQDKTKIVPMGSKLNDHHIYKVIFSKLGENKLTIEYEKNKQMFLEFFVCESLETLIKKRASFIVNKQQHKDPSKWYNGLYSLWDCRLPKGKNLLGPDHLNEQPEFAVGGSDDPSNSKCIYVAQKNVFYPDKKEIASLEYFIKNFVWGKHQRTDKEHPYPYGIYGSENWKQNRFSKNDLYKDQISRPQPKGGSQCRMWRTFDYTTYFALYYNMYLIARQNPEKVKYLDAEGYLERAFGTAKAFFEVPYNIKMQGGWAHKGWCDWAYKLGNFHEKYLIDLIEELEIKEENEKADYLREEWEKKVKYFIYDDKYPFASEMSIDSTAYESTYAAAKYALNTKLKPDNKLWKDKRSGKWYSHPKIDPAKHKDLMKRQHMANLACRGWLETSYYHYGSDFRAMGSSRYTMSYMSQMGGWSVLDYGLNFMKKPEDTIRLGYGSMLCSWGLMNTGNASSKYGFWFPGKNNDGAALWGYQPLKYGPTWNRAFKNWPRGPWPVCGEIDHGLAAAVEASAVVIVDDPIFGLFAYGGIVEKKKNIISVICRDGVRQKIYYNKDKIRFKMVLKSNGFAQDKPVQIDTDLKIINFTLEKRCENKQDTELNIIGLPEGRYKVTVKNKIMDTFTITRRITKSIKIIAITNSPITIKKY